MPEPKSPALDGRVASDPPAGFLRGLYARFANLVREVGKFGIVGAITFLMDLGIYTVLLSEMGKPYWPKTISTVVAATAAFVGNRYWTWRDRSRTALHREYGLYFLFNLIGLGISLACLWLTHSVLGDFWPIFATKGADLISGSIVGVGFASLFRFWAYRRYVFPDLAAAPE